MDDNTIYRELGPTKDFTPPDKCSVCGGEYDEACGGIQGHFGVTPVTFCEWCYGSIYDMVEQDIRDNIREQMNEEDKEDIKTILDAVGIDYKIVENAYVNKQRFFNFRFDEPCGMSRK
jgi:hypothetical protein|tara:strand:- start:188 stop:541 length:354 start_codon:yes stop_codon:yes gene_type:complete